MWIPSHIARPWLCVGGALTGIACYELIRWKVISVLRSRLYCERFGIKQVHDTGAWWWLLIVRGLRESCRRAEARQKEIAMSGEHLLVVGSLPEEMICEMLSRHEAFFGADAHAKLRAAKVCVMGLGGVGSHAAMMLARAGVRRLRLVDFDHVSLSSLNRHAVATLADVGTLKTAAMLRAIREVAPFVEVDPRPIMFNSATSEELLSGEWDLIVDCIDDVETKATLLAACAHKHLRVFSAMGAGAKADPTRLCVSSLADAVHDPLAAKLRWKLRGKGVNYGGLEHAGKTEDAANIECVYSYERPRCALLPLTEEQVAEGAKNFGAVDVDHYRVRVMPVLGASPAIMGQAMAAVALCNLAGRPISPTPREPLSKKLKEKLIAVLRKREARRELGDRAQPARCDWIDLVPEEVEYVCSEVWRGRCAVTRRKIERKPLALARWCRSRRPFGRHNRKRTKVQADDLVLLSPELALALDTALDDCADKNSNPSYDLLFQAAAGALGGLNHAAVVDARFRQMRQAAGGPWFDPSAAD